MSDMTYILQNSTAVSLNIKLYTFNNHLFTPELRILLMKI